MSYFETDTKIEDVYPLHIPGSEMRRITPRVSLTDKTHSLQEVIDLGQIIAGLKATLALERDSIAPLKQEKSRLLNLLNDNAERHKKHIKRLKATIARLNGDLGRNSL